MCFGFIKAVGLSRKAASHKKFIEYQNRRTLSHDSGDQQLQQQQQQPLQLQQQQQILNYHHHSSSSSEDLKTMSEVK